MAGPNDDEPDVALAPTAPHSTLLAEDPAQARGIDAGELDPGTRVGRYVLGERLGAVAWAWCTGRAIPSSTATWRSSSCAPMRRRQPRPSDCYARRVRWRSSIIRTW
jgi:hypothetical protein